MLEGIKALLGSEKALVGGSLVIAATLLVLQGQMTIADWQTYTRDVFYGYVGGKTLTSAVSLWAGTKTSAPAGEVKTETKVETKVETKTEEKAA